MFTIVFSPQWFYGIDIAFDIVGVIVLCLISFFSFRCYLLDKKNWNYLLLSTSFLMIAFSFLFKILTNFTIYYNDIDTERIGFMTLTFNTLQSSDLFFTIGTYLFRLATLFGLLLLLNVTKRQTWHSNIIMSVLFLIIMYFAQNAYPIFHIMCFLLILFITLNYISKYRLNRHKTTLMICYSFAIIGLSHLLFFFMFYSRTFYVIAESLQLAGYVLLLITFIMVLDFGKKEVSNIAIKKPDYKIFHHPEKRKYGQKKDKA